MGFESNKTLKLINLIPIVVWIALATLAPCFEKYALYITFLTPTIYILLKIFINKKLILFKTKKNKFYIFFIWLFITSIHLFIQESFSEESSYFVYYYHGTLLIALNNLYLSFSELLSGDNENIQNKLEILRITTLIFLSIFCLWIYKILLLTKQVMIDSLLSENSISGFNFALSEVSTAGTNGISWYATTICVLSSFFGQLNIKNKNLISNICISTPLVSLIISIFLQSRSATIANIVLLSVIWFNYLKKSFTNLILSNKKVNKDLIYIFISFIFIFYVGTKFTEILSIKDAFENIISKGDSFSIRSSYIFDSYDKITDNLRLLFIGIGAGNQITYEKIFSYKSHNGLIHLQTQYGFIPISILFLYFLNNFKNLFRQYSPSKIGYRKFSNLYIHFFPFMMLIFVSHNILFYMNGLIFLVFSFAFLSKLDLYKIT